MMHEETMKMVLYIDMKGAYKMKSEKFVLLMQDECMDVGGGAFLPVVVPVIKGVIAVCGILRFGMTAHNFLEEAVYEASYDAAYEAEMSRLKEGNSAGQ